MIERFSFDPFVIPYTVGLLFVFAYLIIATIRVIRALPSDDKKKFARHFISLKLFRSIREIFLESLIHRKIWKKKPLLGYMHMSFAFGWFMLIVLGHLEVQLYCPNRLNLPYFPIFFRYFMMETETSLRGALLFFLMDFFLLMVLSGIALAVFKRFRSRRFGMKKTTRLRWNDKIAVWSLWSIFPLRFLAESFTADISGGSFLTHGIGSIFSWFNDFIGNEAMIRPTWWAYSIALCLFFFALPGSRFTHILSEVLLIFMRNAGIKETYQNSGYAKVEIFSCSRCGICIDPCQLVSQAELVNKATVNFTRHLRFWESEAALTNAKTCLQCGRCVQACPVGIESMTLKTNVKRSQTNFYDAQQYRFIPNHPEGPKPTVLYFAGCMSHLTPATPKAMMRIFDAAGVSAHFMDEGGGICCGRPLMQSGVYRSAQILIEKNTRIIEDSGAKTLICSCPICYKVFNETYKLNGIEVLHHSQYIQRLIDQGQIQVNPSALKTVFHDPCDLGRGSGIYEQPREILRRVSSLQELGENQRDDALCCGHSIAAEALPYPKRRQIAQKSYDILCKEPSDVLITACPACKKAFSELENTHVMDLSEIVVKQLVPNTTSL